MDTDGTRKDVEDDVRLRRFKETRFRISPHGFNLEAIH